MTIMGISIVMRGKGDMKTSVYDSNKDGVIAKAQIDPDIMDKATYDPNTDGIIKSPQIDLVFLRLTVAEFKTPTPSGTMVSPERLTDDLYVLGAAGDAIDEYSEIDFITERRISQYRTYGHAGHTLDGRYKIQYFDGPTNAWVDWITDIPTSNTTAWTTWISGSLVYTSKIRLVITTVDTLGVNYIRELEIKD